MIDGRKAVTPYRYRPRRPVRLKRHGQSPGARGFKLQSRGGQRRFDQGQARHFTLGDESTVAIDDHPFAIEGQPALADQRRLKRDSATALDGIEVQRDDVCGHERELGG